VGSALRFPLARNARGTVAAEPGSRRFLDPDLPIGVGCYTVNSGGGVRTHVRVGLSIRPPLAK
jgi:hypothetical protein